MKPVHHDADCNHCQSRFKSVFCDLSKEEIEKLNSKKNCIHFKHNQVIFHEGTSPHGLYCMNSGKVKIVKLGQDGKEQILRLVKPGDVLGYKSLLTYQPYKASAIALEDSDICFIPRESFFLLVQNSHRLSMQIVQLLARELEYADDLIMAMAHKTLRERVAEALIVLKETYGLESDGQTISLSFTRAELANLVGTATESVIRFLSEFQKDELISLDGKKIKIMNLAKLQKTASLYD